MNKAESWIILWEEMKQNHSYSPTFPESNTALKDFFDFVPENEIKTDKEQDVNKYLVYLRKYMAFRFGGKPGSYYPSDYCYNKCNVSTVSFVDLLFVFKGGNSYQLVGPDYILTGPLFSKPRIRGRSTEEFLLGHWQNGKFYADGDELNKWVRIYFEYENTVPGCLKNIIQISENITTFDPHSTNGEFVRTDEDKKLPASDGDNWTDEELNSAVACYLSMLCKEEDGNAYVKKQELEKLVRESLPGRPFKSAEYRMQNISAVLDALGSKWIPGYKPAKHVGQNVFSRIEKILNKYNYSVDTSISEPTADPVMFERRELYYYRQSDAEIPEGVQKPVKNQNDTHTFCRDPQVKGWVLRNAMGKCEGCNSPAPFEDIHGRPYLEHHHVVPFSEGGSDTVKNSVALCPNCHRRCHHSNDSFDFTCSLYENVERLQKPED